MIQKGLGQDLERFRVIHQEVEVVKRSSSNTQDSAATSVTPNKGEESWQKLQLLIETHPNSLEKAPLVGGNKK
jgi:hypothetical protein